MEAFRFIFLQRLANGIELLSALVLLVGFAKTIWNWLFYEIQEARSAQEPNPIGIRDLLAAFHPYLLLGLHVYLAAALISTMLHVDWLELARVAMLGVLSVVIKVDRRTN